MVKPMIVDLYHVLGGLEMREKWVCTQELGALLVVDRWLCLRTSQTVKFYLGSFC